MQTVRDARDRVLRILRQITGSDEVCLQPDLPLYASGLLDSLGTVTLMLALSHEFGIDVSPADFDVQAWATPRRLIADIGQRLATSEHEVV